MIVPRQDLHRSRFRARRLLLTALAVVVVAAFVAWGVIGRSEHVATLRVVADDEATLKVQVIAPAHGPRTRAVSLPGTIKAWYSAPIYAQVSGYVGAWYKDYGAPVKPGELLAVINAPGLDEQYAAAKSGLAVAQSKYKLAEVTAGRFKALSGSQAVSRQEVDVEVASAASEAAQVQAAEHNLARYQALEQFKNVVAPFAGVVTSRDTDVGDYVNAAGGDVSAHGHSTELFTVADIHKMRVFVAVPQTFSTMLKPGLTATLSLPQYPGRLFKATFDTSAHAFNAQTRTVVTELLVDNPDHKLWPGTYADVHFTTSANPNILIIPEQALLFRAQGMQVALVGPHNRVHLQDVTLGHNMGETVQILSGLTPQDRLINNPSAGLLDGETVRVVPGVAGIAPAPQFQTAPALPKHLTEAQRAKVEAARAGTSE
ncbi:efflux RND transporter periplasmic adaptor subunit [Lichenicoccus sp.]|uniref:efflux RND transporter periplasmic adaptor subunit n=1 Tax=Lichenicoccus sp. TaxID=2781899 RepID=UPI003D0B5CFD